MTRDRLTFLVYGHLGLWGYFLFTFGPVIPLLRDDLEISNAVAGLHASMIALGSLSASLLYPWAARTLGRGGLARIATWGLAVGVSALCLISHLSATLSGAFVAGGFGSMLVTGSTVILRARHGRAAPAAITEANAVASALGLLGPALVGLAALAGWSWRPVLLLAVALAAALALSLGDEPVPDADPGEHHDPGRLPLGYWCAWLTVSAVIGVEASMTVWSSELLRERSGLGDGQATAGVSVLLAGMLLGRVAGGALARRHDSSRLLLGALALAAGGFALFWTATAAGPALVGMAVMGTGMALHYPLAVNAAVAAGHANPDRAAGRAALGVGIAGASVPLLMGALSDACDVRTAYMLVPGLLTLAALGVLAGSRGVGTLER
ncbi:MAG: MFS transporter [Sporichthyaceae bacterium]